jgi:hypothetical protein
MMKKHMPNPSQTTDALKSKKTDPAQEEKEGPIQVPENSVRQALEQKPNRKHPEPRTDSIPRA